MADRPHTGAEHAFHQGERHGLCLIADGFGAHLYHRLGDLDDEGETLLERLVRDCSFGKELRVNVLALNLALLRSCWPFARPHAPNIARSDKWPGTLSP